ncbi:hypothetical protein D8Y22_04055 [Salinadaptatus halalkaliphilus]|uniref:TM2 domain-containing protein n=1 Tax=Salinadaptatus halalkaliphilus TaxID=2419781 RepID=A0A4S3TP59_9EURY|nr:hypothetical protein [Salinadaptatus halalkaliphilus]THE66104.1 hypothetical protein D8Y22_04055 [Salinadaptatus halalkaliphilus]
MATAEQSTAAESGTSPIVAAIVSFIIPGVGHYIAGHEKRGLYWIGGFLAYYALAFVLSLVLIGIVLFLASPLLHIAAAADGYLQTS